MSLLTLNVLDIIRGTTVDGPGFRTSIYLAGCRHKCPGCHNPQSWDFNAGTPMSIGEIMEIVREEDFNVTISGGDPMFQPEALTALCREISAAGYTIWIYTGFKYETLREDKRFDHLWPLIDTIVDGQFIESLKDPDLRFRGSSNQRIIPIHS